MRITATGNVGIGNSVPALPDADTSNVHLVVGTTVLGTPAYGEITMCSNQGGTGGAVGVLNFANYNLSTTEKRIAGIGGVIDSGSANSGMLQFYTWNAGAVAVPMVIKASGLVGIGTTAPYSRLHVRTAASGAPSAITGDTVVFAENSGNAYYEIVGGPGTGNQVGLVLGSNVTNNSSQVFDVYDGSTHSLRLISNLPGSYMTFFTAGVEHMRITAAGNVGIGTSNPGANLDVNGLMACTYLGGQSGTAYNACLTVQSDRNIPGNPPNNTMTFVFSTGTKILTLYITDAGGNVHGANIQFS